MERYLKPVTGKAYDPSQHSDNIEVAAHGHGINPQTENSKRKICGGFVVNFIPWYVCMMANPCVYCAIIDHGCIDTAGIFTHLPQLYSYLHHQSDFGEPSVLPSHCKKWMFPLNERIHLLENA